MTQPTFAPVPASGEVRATSPTQPAELGRTPKAGLLRPAHRVGGVGRGTPAPGGGFALTIAQREVAKLYFDNEHDRPDVVLGVALVAAKRASLVGRGPILEDVAVAMDLFALREVDVVDHRRAETFRGIAHGYAAQRRFVDGVADERLTTALTAS